MWDMGHCNGQLQLLSQMLALVSIFFLFAFISNHEVDILIHIKQPHLLVVVLGCGSAGSKMETHQSSEGMSDSPDLYFRISPRSAVFL